MSHKRKHDEMEVEESELYLNEQKKTNILLGKLVALSEKILEEMRWQSKHLRKKLKTGNEQSTDACVICFENTKGKHVLLCKTCNECICVDCINKMKERSKFETCSSCCREIGLK